MSRHSTNPLEREVILHDYVGVGVPVLALMARIETARHVARLGELTYQQPVAIADLIIAATAVRHGLTLLTHNMSDMGRLGIGARDPFVKLPPDS